MILRVSTGKQSQLAEIRLERHAWKLESASNLTTTLDEKEAVRDLDVVQQY